MAVGTTTLADFLVDAVAAFETRFGDDIMVCLPDGYAKKVYEGYEGAMIVLALEFAARDPEQEQGGFDPPMLATLRVRVYTAVGFANYDAKDDAYQAGLTLVSDIIGWCDRRRFVEGQYGLQFVSMNTADYDVTESFQVQWVIDFTAPLRFDHDRRPDAPDDDFVSYGDYTGRFPPTRVRARFPTPAVGMLGLALGDTIGSTTLTLATNAQCAVDVGDYLQIDFEFVRVTTVLGQRNFMVERAQLETARVAHAVGQDVTLHMIDQVHPLGIVGALDDPMTDDDASTTLHLAADATMKVLSRPVWTTTFRSKTKSSR